MLRLAAVVVLCEDLDTARSVSALGVTVVLIGADGDTLSRAAAGLRAAPARVGIFVGDPSDPGVWDLAATMATELYGSDVRRIERRPRSDL